MKTICRLLLYVLMLGACGQKPQQTKQAIDSLAVQDRDTTLQLTLLFAGDLMQHMPQVVRGLQPDGSYCFDSCFQYVRPIIDSADLAFGNFETTLGGRPYTGFPQFSSPDGFLKSLQWAGFDVLLTANNHCCDRKMLGLKRTIEQMDSLHVPHAGTYIDSIARQKQYPLLLEKNGFRIAILCATYGTNGLPVPQGAVVNTLDTIELAQDIRKAKQMKPDLILAVMHWGVEYQRVANQQQRKLAQWLIEQGVDHIIASHPHVVQPYEIMTDKQQRKHLIAYSLGNYFSNQPKPECATGLMMRLQLEKTVSVLKMDSVVPVALKKVEPIITWVSRPSDSGRKQYYIYPLYRPDSLLNTSEKIFLKRVRQELPKKICESEQ